MAGAHERGRTDGKIPRRPAVVCVQELQLDDAAFPHQALEEAGYVAFSHGQTAWNGVGVLVHRT